MAAYLSKDDREILRYAYVAEAMGEMNLPTDIVLAWMTSGRLPYMARYFGTRALPRVSLDQMQYVLACENVLSKAGVLFKDVWSTLSRSAGAVQDGTVVLEAKNFIKQMDLFISSRSGQWSELLEDLQNSVAAMSISWGELSRQPVIPITINVGNVDGMFTSKNAPVGLFKASAPRGKK